MGHIDTTRWDLKNSGRLGSVLWILIWRDTAHGHNSNGHGSNAIKYIMRNQDGGVRKVSMSWSRARSTNGSGGTNVWGQDKESGKV